MTPSSNLVLVFLALGFQGSTAVQQRSHNHGPEWIDHCWDTASNHLMDPFCAFLTNIACGTIPEVDHATHTVPENTKPGALVTYTCDESYSLDGNDTIVCAEVEKDGSKTAVWKGTPFCMKRKCSEAPRIDNGQSLPYNETAIGEIVQYVCDNEFAFNSSHNFVMCQNDTFWSTPPTCERVCPPPPSISHGTYTQKVGPLFPGTEIEYICSKQYEIHGNSTILCGMDGKWTAIPLCECRVRPLDILFILDASGSVGRDGFNKTLSFVNDIVDVYGDANTNFALISFSNSVVLGFNFNTYENDTRTLKEAVGNISYTTGYTDTAMALRYAREHSFTVQNGMRDSATKIAIVVTDGASDDAINTTNEATLLKNNNVTIYSVGIGVADDKELNAIASSESYVFHEENYSNISQVSGPLAQAICLDGCLAVPHVEHARPLNPLDTYVGAIVNYECDSGYRLQSTDYAECNETRNWSTAPVCVKIPTCAEPSEIEHGFHGVPTTYEVGGTVQYNCNNDQTYTLTGNATAVCEENNGVTAWTPIPKCECEKNLDIVFIVDGSGSVGSFGFEDTLDFVNDMISRYSAATVRFGLLVYSSIPHLEFHLNAFVDDVDSLKDKVANASYPTGNTLTYDALSFARTDMFRERNGMRPNASQIAIVITDGKSTDSNKTIKEAEKLKATGVTVYSVGVGADVDEDELSSMASSPKFVFHVDDYANISTVTGPLEETTCIVDCGPPPVIDNGFAVNGTNTLNGDIVTYECDPGFVMRSSDNITCQGNAIWTTAPICIPGECGVPPTIEHGYALNKNDTYFGAIVNYTCETGYVFVSNYDVICLTTGNWTDAPICRRAQCGHIPVVLHGISSLSNNTFVGTMINYTCDTKYRLVGMETVTCQENEMWSAIPTCECQSEPLDIVFIADTSGSIGGVGFQTTLDFITKMTESYPKATTHFGMITFSSNASVEFYLDTFVNNYTGLLQAIKDAYFSAGGTDTYEAFQLARSEVFNVSNGMRENVTEVAVVVTDGQSNNSNLTIIEAQNLKDAGVTIYSVGVGDFDTVELKAIASSESYVFSVQTFGDLSSVTGPLSSLICLGDTS